MNQHRVAMMLLVTLMPMLGWVGPTAQFPRAPCARSCQELTINDRGPY